MSTILENSELYKSIIDEMPIFKELIDIYKQTKPFNGKTIAIAHVIVPNTLPLINACIAAGAEIEVTDCIPSTVDPATKELLLKANIKFEHELIDATGFDYAIDCTAYFVNYPPKEGISEVTRSGIHRYMDKLPSVPIFDCDTSKTKMIETFLGNPLSIKTAYEKFVEPIGNLASKRIAVMGFGKIGRGIARVFREFSSLTVIDINKEVLEKAVKLGYDIYQLSDIVNNDNFIQNIDVIMTATGFPSVVSNNFTKINSEKTLLLNIGAVDEYGEKYSDEEVFMSKTIPFNFNLTPPTENKYIDPILSLHVEGIRYLIENSCKPEIIHVPNNVDTKLVKLFEENNFVVSELIEEYFG